MIKFCNTVPDVRSNNFNDYATFKEKVNYSITKALYSGQLSNFGPLYQEFKGSLEVRFNLVEGRDVVITSSGHTALMAAYAVLDIKRLLVPCFTFESTRVAATEMGINVTVVDVNKYDGSFNYDVLNDIDKDSYDAIVVVAPLSSIPNLEMFDSFCKRNDKKLIIDGAATFGTTGIHKYGDMFCMSLHATKPFPMGEGGLVICNEEYTERVEQYLTFGLTKDKVATRRGINGKISEYSCAIGLGLLEIIDKHLNARKVNALYLKNKLSWNLEDRVKYLYSWNKDDTVYQSLPIFIDKSEELIKHLNFLGIQCIKYYKPLNYMPSKVSDDFINSYYLYKRNVCLPVHSGLSLDDLDYMVDTITEFYNGSK